MTDYWKNRFIKSTKDVFDSDEEYVKEIFKIYESTIEDLDSEIFKLLNSMEDVSMAEAKKLLNKYETRSFKSGLDEFRKASKGFISPDVEKELDIVSRRVRISRLQAMQVSMKSKVASLLNQEQKKLFAHLSNKFTSSYYKDLYELQRITGYKNINSLSKDFVNNILNTSWTNDGENFSDRIWKRKDKLLNTLDTELRQGLITGKRPDEITKVISDKLEVSKSNAKRLVLTESSAIHSQSRKAVYERMGVEKYQIVATLDLRTSHICRDLDGKVFDVKDYERGVTAPPFHAYCYDKETEVLTNNGWKFFKDMKNDDLVYTLNPNTKTPKWQSPVNLISYRYKGAMVKYLSDRFDLLVTPNHKMLVQNMDSSVKDKNYKLRQAYEIGIKSKSRIPCGIDWIGEDKQTIELVGKKIDIKTYLKFMAYWLSDGSVTKSKGRYRIKIAQCDNDWMWDALINLPFKKYKCKESIMIECNELGEMLSKFGKCNEKYIPDNIKSLNRELIKFFLNEYAKCDGSIKKGKFWKGYQFDDSTSFFTSSNQLAADLGELILKAGGRPSYSLCKCAGNKVKFSNGIYTLNYDVWTIFWNKQTYSWICYMNIDKSFYYDDFVYCVEVPEYNTLYVRRNGKCCWSGNCRSTTVPYYNDDIQAEIENTRMARDPETGKSLKVENLTYKEWYSKYIVEYNYKKEYENIVSILGYKAVGNLEKYRDIKYNDVERYNDIQKDYGVIDAINKNGKILDKERAKKLYYNFKAEGIYTSDHFIEHFIDREYKNNGEINHTFNEIVELCKEKPNYIDTRNEKQIISKSGVNIFVENGKYITLRKGRVSKHWKKI